MGKIVVGCWDCDYCGADRISGEVKICPKCGKPRGKDITFYMAGAVNPAARILPFIWPDLKSM